MSISITYIEFWSTILGHEIIAEDLDWAPSPGTNHEWIPKRSCNDITVNERKAAARAFLGVGLDRESATFFREQSVEQPCRAYFIAICMRESEEGHLRHIFPDFTRDWTVLIAEGAWKEAAACAKAASLACHGEGPGNTPFPPLFMRTYRLLRDGSQAADNEESRKERTRARLIVAGSFLNAGINTEGDQQSYYDAFVPERGTRNAAGESLEQDLARYIHRVYDWVQKKR